MDKYEEVSGKFGEISLFPLPTNIELKEHYENQYFQNITSKAYNPEYTQLEIDHIQLKNRELIAAINEFVCIENANVLDLGCGEGFLLNEFLVQGAKILGIDFGDFAIKKYNPHLLKFLKKRRLSRKSY